MQIDSYQLKTKYIVKNKNVGATLVVALNFKELQQGQVQDLLLH